MLKPSKRKQLTVKHSQISLYTWLKNGRFKLQMLTLIKLKHQQPDRTFAPSVRRSARLRSPSPPALSELDRTRTTRTIIPATPLVHKSMMKRRWKTRRLLEERVGRATSPLQLQERSPLFPRPEGRGEGGREKESEERERAKKSSTWKRECQREVVFN